MKQYKKPTVRSQRLELGVFGCYGGTPNITGLGRFKNHHNHGHHRH